MATRKKPAFYVLRGSKGWQDYLNLLHVPYTLWHLGYVVLGAAVAPTVHVDRLLGTLLAFFLAVGIASHALDELHDSPGQRHRGEGNQYRRRNLGAQRAVVQFI